MVASDVNLDGDFNISDPVALLNFLFAGIPLADCLIDGEDFSAMGVALADFNGDGNVDISNPVGKLNRLFGGGDPAAAGEGCQVFEVETTCEPTCTIEG